MNHPVPPARLSTLRSNSRADFQAAGHTLANIRRDFVEWHHGRPHYALWALDLDHPAVHARCQAAATALDGLLLEDYRRQPHLTLALCGFPRARAMTPDECDADRIEAAARRLQSAAPTPFALHIGALDSFSSAPFLRATAPCGALAGLRRALARSALDRPDADYTPHVTVGLYRAAWPVDQVLVQMAACPPAATLQCHVERLSLLCYDSADIGGPLRTLAVFDLAARRLEWLDRTPFAATGPQPGLSPTPAPG